MDIVMKAERPVKVLGTSFVPQIPELSIGRIKLDSEMEIWRSKERNYLYL